MLALDVFSCQNIKYGRNETELEQNEEGSDWRMKAKGKALEHALSSTQ